MLRFRFVALLVVVALTLLWVVPVAAADPDPNTCLPTCYAYNKGQEGWNGTESFPWPSTDVASLITAMKDAAKDKYDFATLEVITCNDANPPQCTAILHTFYRNGGDPTSVNLGTVPVPTVGTPLPFPYLLGGGLLVGTLLLGSGIVLGRRARRHAA